MDKLKSFISTTFLGGIIVILPVIILVAAFGWVFNFVTNLIQPFTNILKKLLQMQLFWQLF